MRKLNGFMVLLGFLFGCDDGAGGGQTVVLVDAGIDAAVDGAPGDGSPPDGSVDVDSEIADQGADGAADFGPDLGLDAEVDAQPLDASCGPFGDAAPVEPPVEVTDLPRGGLGDGCRADELFIEVPATAPVPHAGFAESLARRLGELDPAWFCAAGDAACLTRVSAQIEQRRFATLRPLLPPETPHAGEAGFRFFRLPLAESIQPAGLGPLVSAVRQWAAQAGAVAYVGRTCAAVLLANEPRATPELRARALARLGLEALPPGPPSDPVVDVVLLDTGVDPQVAALLEVSTAPLPGGDIEGVPHGHGAAMALLVRQVTDRAQLHDLRVLGSGGVGSIGNVARGLIGALAIAQPGRPLLINLSLGWPPELGVRRLIRDEAGQVVGFEDPAGESVRYALELARQAGAVVIAAAGNRPGRPEANAAVYGTWFDVEPGAQPPTTCAEMTAGPRLFFPAEWSRVPTCLGGAPRFLVWAVGAVGAGDDPAELAIRGAEPALVAPGEHAYVDAPQVSETPAEFVCDAPAAPAFESPAVISGTSVAAALTTATAARLLAEDPTLAPAPLQHRVTAAGRLLRPGVRLLDTCRAEAALSCLSAACTADALVFGRPLDADLEACALSLSACPTACPAPTEPPPPAPAFEFLKDEVCLCSQSPGTPLVPADCATAATLCAFETGIDVHSRGYAAPQPLIPSCPECLAALEGPTLDLHLALDRRLAGVTFTTATVQLDTGAGLYWRTLTDTSALDRWAAGQSVLIRGIPLPPAAATGCRTRCVATLHALIQSPAGPTALSATLRTKVQ